MRTKDDGGVLSDSEDEDPRLLIQFEGCVCSLLLFLCCRLVIVFLTLLISHILRSLLLPRTPDFLLAIIDEAFPLIR